MDAVKFHETPLTDDPRRVGKVTALYMEYSSFCTKFLCRLNCGSLHAIPPYGMVRYKMKMPTPADAPTGEASIHWVFFGPANVASGRLMVQ